ncbi:MAG: glycosyltransferase family 2 protein [Gemmataceae bacterium]|nr:glycosyltransferase family 2 protein [Gemmataceae bacterium]
MPSRERVALLKRCLETVRRRAPLATEIIVVDDGSREGIISQAAGKFPGVRVLRLEKNQGFCQAANAGVSAAVGEIVQLLNDDTEVCPGFAEAALEEFNQPQVGAVAPLVLRWPGWVNGPEIIDSAGDAYYRSGIAAKRGNGQPFSGAWEEAGEVFGASGSSVFFRRELFLRVGGFPAHFGGYFEDVDLSFRIRQAGFQIRYQPASRILHHVSATYGSSATNRKLVEQQARNEERVFWRNMPGPKLASCLVPHFLSLLGKAWKRGSEGNLLPYLLGKLGVLFEAGEIVSHRKWLVKNLGKSESAVEKMEATLAPKGAFGRFGIVFPPGSKRNILLAR